MLQEFFLNCLEIIMKKKKQQKKQQKSWKILFEFFWFKNSQIHICKKNTHFHNDFPK